MQKTKDIILLNNIKDGQRLKSTIENDLKIAEVTLAKNFDEFYKLINEFDYNCFYLDESLSEINTFDLIKKLRQTKKFHRSIISIITAKPESYQAMDLKEKEINLAISLNFSLDDIQNVYKKTVSSHQFRLIPGYFKILIIDDDPDIVEIISGHLENLGHDRFEKCHNYRSALEKISDGEYDMILVDWNLGDGTCLELLESIKLHAASEKTRNSIIVVITGRNEIDDMMTLLKYKVDDQIIKPFDEREFEEKIEYAINKKLKKGSTR